MHSLKTRRRFFSSCLITTAGLVALFFLFNTAWTAESETETSSQTTPEESSGQPLAFDSGFEPGDRVALVIGNADYQVGGPDMDLGMKFAEEWITGLDIAEGGWRFPTMQELDTLYVFKDGRATHFHPAFGTTGLFAWAEPGIRDNKPSYQAKGIREDRNAGMAGNISIPQPGYRVFAVRKAKGSGP